MTLRTLMAFERRRWSVREGRLNKGIFLVLAILWMGTSVLLAAKGWFGKSMFTYSAFAWLALWGMLYTAPGLGARATVREWKEDTLYWWLSLPAPCEKLFLAKTLVALERWCRIYVLVFVYVVLYIFLLDVANGIWSWELLLSQLQVGLAEVLLAIALGPFLLMVGLLMGVFRRSGFRLAVPLLWLVVIAIANIQTNLVLGLGFAGQGEAFHLVTELNLAVMLSEGVVAYGLAALIFKVIVDKLKQGRI